MVRNLESQLVAKRNHLKELEEQKSLLRKERESLQKQLDDEQAKIRKSQKKLRQKQEMSQHEVNNFVWTFHEFKQAQTLSQMLTSKLFELKNEFERSFTEFERNWRN